MNLYISFRFQKVKKGYANKISYFLKHLSRQANQDLRLIVYSAGVVPN
jgi:hypothetical protein